MYGRTPCKAKKSRKCSKCHSILTSVCSKAACKESDEAKPNMINPFCDTKKKVTRKMLFSSDEGDNESENTQFDHDTSYVEDEQEETDGESYDSGENITKN